MPALAFATLAHPNCSQPPAVPPRIVTGQLEQAPDKTGCIILGNASLLIVHGPMSVKSQPAYLGKIARRNQIQTVL